MRYPSVPCRTVVLGVVVAVLTGCATPRVTQGTNDPYEAQNRAVHAYNKRSDRTFLRPVSQAYGKSVPEPLRNGISNFAGNIDLPRSVVNDVLQANVDDAAHNAVRFLINSTFGIAGIFDPASAWGLDARTSDFGETLHVWGATEGHYVELPVLGPSTKRDAFGRLLDL